ncbi:PLP-dependent aminotransferase family protein [Methylocystis sp. Sn-Cys]|uniref:MocR-like pyridoxine biosynthesis transcription factor PdxR n=1 Tax=Methylocystis sp. Sn-Cys TaxID=1701263 RepID=UPI001FF0684F|nr:PLP-dependent aminotransferase family protein [Methylocystis sp. Sn-Cys]
MYHRPMRPFPITLDRKAKTPLSTQIYAAIRDAVRDGQLASGVRLPSWSDLAALLGVARGTVRVAYERLSDEQFTEALGPGGTRVAQRIGPPATQTQNTPRHGLRPDLFRDFDRPPLLFQMGVPAQDAFPFSQWSRLMARHARAAAAAPVCYPDPRGEAALREAICAYLAIARGVSCKPEQVLVTAGFTGALGLALRALPLRNAVAWAEEPGFPLTRDALTIAGLAINPIRVDCEGLDVCEGVRQAPDAALAIVTPGQQAPLGMTMSLARRAALLQWTRDADAWIIEDDYLGELQLDGRAAPALASLDRDARVIYAGTFSKTISPSLRLGFLVVPPPLAARFAEATATLTPAPAPATQRAVAAFIAEGHFLRHLRRMKRLYRARRNALANCLRAASGGAFDVAAGGLGVCLTLPPDADDREIAARAIAAGFAPTPLSSWYHTVERQGLLLGATNLFEPRLAEDCARFMKIVTGQ